VYRALSTALNAAGTPTPLQGYARLEYLARRLASHSPNLNCCVTARAAGYTGNRVSLGNTSSMQHGGVRLKVRQLKGVFILRIPSRLGQDLVHST